MGEVAQKYSIEMNLDQSDPASFVRMAFTLYVAKMRLHYLRKSDPSGPFFEKVPGALLILKFARQIVPLTPRELAKSYFADDRLFDAVSEAFSTPALLNAENKLRDSLGALPAELAYCLQLMLDFAEADSTELRIKCVKGMDPSVTIEEFQMCEDYDWTHSFHRATEKRLAPLLMKENGFWTCGNQGELFVINRVLHRELSTIPVYDMNRIAGICEHLGMALGTEFHTLGEYQSDLDSSRMRGRCIHVNFGEIWALAYAGALRALDVTGAEPTKSIWRKLTENLPGDLDLMADTFFRWLAESVLYHEFGHHAMDRHLMKLKRKYGLYSGHPASSNFYEYEQRSPELYADAVSLAESFDPADTLKRDFHIVYCLEDFDFLRQDLNSWQPLKIRQGERVFTLRSFFEKSPYEYLFGLLARMEANIERMEDDRPRYRTDFTEEESEQWSRHKTPYELWMEAEAHQAAVEIAERIGVGRGLVS